MEQTAEFRTLLATSQDGLGRITLNQPERLNPLGLQTLHEIAEASEWMNTTDASVVVVTGAGDRAFSAGFDLKDFDTRLYKGRPGADLGARMADAVESIEAVTIAAIHGHCIGGGVVLASACDMRIADESTRFSIPEVDLGIPLAWGGIPRLVREIGPAATRELVMTCRPFGAQEAFRLGFLNKVAPTGTLEAEVETLSSALAGKAPSLIKTTKRQVNNAIEAVVSARDGWIGQALLDAAAQDPQARAAAKRYLASRQG